MAGTGSRGHQTPEKLIIIVVIMIADCNLHLSQRVLLHPVAGHLAARLQRHGVLHELPVQEGDPASQ